jgi:hypothetical protein
MGALRKHMNGAVLDTFRCYGADYGVNYGVAIHTLRDMAAEQGVDDEFARYLYQQQIRELRIIALWCAEPAKVCTEADVEYWGEGIINSEVAEQASHALLSRIAPITELLSAWCASDNALLAYCALLSAARNGGVEPTVAVEAIVQAVTTFSDNRLVAQGATALAINLPDEEVAKLLEKLPDNPTAQHLREEVQWRVA